MTTAISHATCMTAIDLGAKAIIYSQPFRKHCKNGFQIPSGLRDRRMLAGGTYMQTAEHVLGHHAGSY